MAGKKFSKAVISSISVLMAAAVLAVPGSSAFDAIQNAEDRKKIQEQISDSKNELNSTIKTIEEKEKLSKELQGQIQKLSQKIKASNEKIKKLNQQIKDNQKKIDKKLEAIEDRLALLRKRLRAIYTAGDISSLEIILKAKDFDDYIDKMELVRSVATHDDNLIKNLQKEMKDISKEQEKLRQDKSKVESEKKTLESDKNKINQLSADNELLLSSLNETKSKTEDSIKENEKRDKELEDALKKYNKELADKLKKLREEAKKNAQKNNTSNTKKNNSGNSGSTGNNGNSGNSGNNGNSGSSDNNYSGNQDDNSQDNNESNYYDGYVWPCPGHTYLTSTFDEWRGVNNHGALDIADGSVYGAAVVACWEGTVFSVCTSCTHDYGKSSSCGCGGGYGNYVMIDHGGGKVSIYGHLSSVTAYSGQHVEPGQLIGYVGSTGYSTGPHLHFEMQYNGVRYDPLTEYN